MDRISLILNIALIIIVLYMAFFKSYFKQKGKNIATREDIGRITTIVEKIRQRFDRDTEKIKQQLIYLNQKKITMISEERESIIGFYQSYYKWLNQIMNFSIDTINDEDSFEYTKIKNELKNLQIEVDCSIGRVDLFFYSEDFNEIKLSLLTNTIKLREVLDLYLIRYNSLSNQIKQYKALPNTTETHQKILDLMNDQVNLSTTFYNDRVEAFKIVYNDIPKIRSILKKRLETILTQ